MTGLTESKESFTKHFEQIDRAHPDANLLAVRQSGRRKFRELPFPSARTEDWRFTSVAPILRESFVVAEPTALAPESLPVLPTPDTLRLTFVNGWFSARLSHLDGMPAGIHVGPLAKQTAPTKELQQLAKIADFKDQVFTALNTSLVNDGAYLSVPDGVVLERPVEILYLAESGGQRVLATPRTLIVLGKNSQARVVERYLSQGAESDVYFTNAVTEISLADHAVLDHVKLQQESRAAYHVANTQVVQGRSSKFTTHYLSIGGGLVRNEVRVRFDEEHGEATVNGLYLADGQQHVDNYTVIDHARPNCQSHELYKGVLNGRSHGVFNGKIFVRKDAQKTDAKQTNKVLLLSDDATINTKPQLEIFADDVKCTHGATVGQLDDEQTYYLRTRGIPHDEARRLLTFAFANDIVTRIHLQAIRTELEAILVRST